MAGAEHAEAERWLPWWSPIAAAAILLGIGLLPAASAHVAIVDHTAGEEVSARSTSEMLLGHSRWTFLAAVVLVVVGLAAGSFLERRRPAWFAPSVLSVTSLLALAFATDFTDPGTNYAPFADRVNEARAEARALADVKGFTGISREYVDPDPEIGAWLLIATLAVLGVAAAVWLGRVLGLRERFPWVTLVVAIAATLAWTVADTTTPCNADAVQFFESRLNVGPKPAEEWKSQLGAYTYFAGPLIALGALSQGRVAAAAKLAVVSLVGVGVLVVAVWSASGGCIA